MQVHKGKAHVRVVFVVQDLGAAACVQHRLLTGPWPGAYKQQMRAHLISYVGRAGGRKHSWAITGSHLVKTQARSICGGTMVLLGRHAPAPWQPQHASSKCSVLASTQLVRWTHPCACVACGFAILAELLCGYNSGGIELCLPHAACTGNISGEDSILEMKLRFAEIDRQYELGAVAELQQIAHGGHGVPQQYRSSMHTLKGLRRSQQGQEACMGFLKAAGCPCDG